MKVLCVAEKPSIAKGITNILSNGHWETVILCLKRIIYEFINTLLLILIINNINISRIIALFLK